MSWWRTLQHVDSWSRGSNHQPYGLWTTSSTWATAAQPTWRRSNDKLLGDVTLTLSLLFTVYETNTQPCVLYCIVSYMYMVQCLFMVQPMLVGFCLLSFLNIKQQWIVLRTEDSSLVIYFLWSLTLQQDTGIVTTATCLYLFSNQMSAYFLSLYTVYDFIFITDMFLCLFVIIVFGHKSHGTVDFYRPLEMMSVGDFYCCG